MKRILRILPLMLLALPASSQEATWTLKHPWPVYYGLIDVEVLSSNTYIAIGQYGTIIKTTDGGSSWVNSNLPNFFRTLNDVSFADATVGVVVGDSGTILKTTDAGMSWIIPAHPYSGSSKPILATCMVDEATIYACADWTGVILKSIDGGATWIQQFTVNNQVNSICFSDRNNGYLVGAAGTRYMTTNGGSTWTAATYIGPFDLWSVSLVNSLTAIAVGAHGAVLRTTNGGSTWTYNYVPVQGFAIAPDFYSVSMRPDGVGIIVAAGGVILRTTDAGVTWTQMLSPTSTYLLGVSAANSGEAVAVGQIGIMLKSTNQGMSWATLSKSVTSVYLTDVAFADAHTGVVSGESGTLLRTSDDGDTWLPIVSGTGKRIHVAPFATSRHSIAVADSGQVFTTTDGGASWKRQNTGTTQSLVTGAYADDSVCIAIGYGQTILRSRDAGSTWTLIPVSFYVTPNAIAFFDRAVGIIGSSGGQIFRTTDRGISWSAISLPATYQIVDLSIIDPNTAYALMNNGTIYKSVDQGQTWQSRATGYTFQRFSFADANNGVALALYPPRIYRTSNAGTTWTLEQHPASQNSSASLNMVTHFQASASCVVGSDGLIMIYKPQKDVALSVPVLTNPTNRATVTSPAATFGWSRSIGSSRYELQVAQDSTFSSLVLKDTSLLWRWRQLDNLEKGKTYFWRVRGTLGSLQGQFSSIGSFTVAGPPGAPSLLSPATAASGILLTVTFQWAEILGATSYWLQLSKDNAMTSLVFNDSTLVKTSKDVQLLEPSTQYYWRVAAKNPYGTSPFSSIWTFRTGSLPAIPTLLSPSQSSINVSLTPLLQWSNVQGATSYWLQVSKNDLFTPQLIDDPTLSDTSKQLGTLALNTTYYWRVAAGNNVGISPFSPASQFRTVVTSSAEDRNQIPTQFALQQNYPNPFNPATVISYQLPKSSFVVLEVINAVGQRVALLVNERKGKGYHQAQWNAAGHPSGIYFYRLKAEGFVETKKMIVLQ